MTNSPDSTSSSKSASPQDECSAELINALYEFFTYPVELPAESAGAAIGTIWWESDGRYSYPWRVTGERLGYPCGEPVSISDHSVPGK